MSDSKQTSLLVDPPEKPGPETVYIVASNYDGDPHPHIEGVFSEKEQAEGLMAMCQDRFREPHPIAWQLVEAEIDGEVAYL